jgi:pimeloyl-ACP methyl ester carboxylesterase
VRSPPPLHASRLEEWRGQGALRLVGERWDAAGLVTVVLLHGGGQTRHAWKGVGRALAALGYRVIAMDARGHGDSEWARDGDYSLDAMVSDLEQVVAKLDCGPLALVGASMGGLTSMLAVGEGRVAASALLLVDVAPEVNPVGRRRILDFMAHQPEGFGSLQEVADLIAAYQPHRPRPASLAGLRKNLRLTSSGKYRWHWDPAFHAAATRWSRDEARLNAAASRLTVPVFLVRGQFSDVLTEEAAEAFCGLCPHAERFTVRQAAHMVAGDQNDVFGDALAGFLERHLPAGGEAAQLAGRPRLKRDFGEGAS